MMTLGDLRRATEGLPPETMLALDLGDGQAWAIDSQLLYATADNGKTVVGLVGTEECGYELGLLTQHNDYPVRWDKL